MQNNAKRYSSRQQLKFATVLLQNLTFLWQLSRQQEIISYRNIREISAIHDIIVTLHRSKYYVDSGAQRVQLTRIICKNKIIKAQISCPNAFLLN